MKEIKLSIPLKNKYGMITTKQISGYLDSFLILTKNKLRIMVESEYGYPLFISNDLDKGIHYIPLRTQPLDERGHRLNFQACKISLNEKLIIQIMSTEGEEKEVKLIIRYDTTNGSA